HALKLGPVAAVDEQRGRFFVLAARRQDPRGFPLQRPYRFRGQLPLRACEQEFAEERMELIHELAGFEARGEIVPAVELRQEVRGAAVAGERFRARYRDLRQQRGLEEQVLQFGRGAVEQLGGEVVEQRLARFARNIGGGQIVLAQALQEQYPARGPAADL